MGGPQRAIANDGTPAITVYVRFGSEADICSAKRHVRFTPNSERKSGHSQEVMSALPPKADMCSARADVCYGQIADIPSSNSLSLFDGRVGTIEQRERHVHPERLSG